MTPPGPNVTFLTAKTVIEGRVILFSATHFGKYLLLDKLGSGGMAELFLAKQSGLQGFEKVVAIKRILPHLTENPEFVNMFINEAKLAALLSHQNIVQIFDLGSINQMYYIAMEYIMGKDLRTLSKEARERKLPLGIGNVLLIISRICAALDYAHRKRDLSGRELNLVHRDISPQNILVSYEGEVKLVDFGIAKAATGVQETQTGVLKGKLAYMSPEQAWGKPLDRRSDLFSLGIVLYEMLTETRLFKGNDEISILEKVRSAEIQPPSRLHPEITPQLDQAILKALARGVEDRYQSASEMQVVLEGIITQKGYAFSSLSLANCLQVLYRDEIGQDTKRLALATGGDFPVAPEDKSTYVRPRTQRGPSPTGIQRSGRTAVKKTVGSRLSTAIVASLFSVAGICVLSLLLLSNLPGVVRARQAVPALQVALDRVEDYFREKGVLDSLGRFKVGLLALIAPSEPLALSHPPPPPSRPPVESPQSPVQEPKTPSGARPEPDGPESFTSEPTGFSDPKQNREEIRQLFITARGYYNAGKINETEKTLRQIIELDPSAKMAYHLLGTVFLERKDTDGALRIFSEASILFPNDPLLHFDVGSIYFQKGTTSLAADELTQSIKLNPQAPYARRTRKMLRRLGIPAQEPDSPLPAPEAHSAQGEARSPALPGSSYSAPVPSNGGPGEKTSGLAESSNLEKPR